MSIPVKNSFFGGGGGGGGGGGRQGTSRNDSGIKSTAALAVTWDHCTVLHSILSTGWPATLVSEDPVTSSDLGRYQA